MKYLRVLAIALILGFVGIVAQAEQFNPATYGKNKAEVEPFLKRLDFNYEERVTMCKACIVKITKFKETSKKHILTDQTMKAYMKRYNFYCGSIIADQTEK